MKTGLPAGKLDKSIIAAFSFVALSSIFAGFYFEKLGLVALPFLLIFIFLAMVDYSKIYYILIASIPLSVHVTFNSYSVDLLSEPLMLALLLLFPFIFILKNEEFNFLKHPLILLMLAHVGWVIFVSFFSVSPLHSVKYILSKLWYLVPFVLITGAVLKNASDFKKIFWLFFIPLIIVSIYTTIRHASEGFSFEFANFAMNPFFHNHVLYSTTIAVFLPFVWYARYWYATWSLSRIFINTGFLILLFGVGIAYTRASWLAVLMAVPIYFMVKLRLTKPALLFSGLILICGIFFLIYKNQYLEYSVEYRKVIFHKGDIEKHLAATYEMKDVSGMERVYRWAAAKRMIADNFWVGTGPSTFYPEYKKYTVNSFTTYVSDNPEKSTTHNYFIMIFSEQGLMGFLLFTALYILLLIKASDLYLSFKDKFLKGLSMAAILSLLILFIHLTLNDLIETDKVGSLFFITVTLLIKMDLWKRQGKDQETAQET